MTSAQREALARVAAATKPIRLPGPTARILHQRFGYIYTEGDGWVLSHRGRAQLAGQRAQEQHHEAERRLTREDRDWADRVQAWLVAHKRFRPDSYPALRYARHVAACDHAGIEPVAEGQWRNEDRQWVEDAVRAAARILRDFDKACGTATARGVGISVSYEPDEKVPRSRREAAREAADGTVVSLRTYRERRPTRDGGAA